MYKMSTIKNKTQMPRKYLIPTAFLLFAFATRMVWLDSEILLATTVEVGDVKNNTTSTVSNYSNMIVEPSVEVTVCHGTPQERRLLVEKGDNATKGQWLNMMEHVEKREKKFVGFYALHVSKSGGSSLCKLFKAENCWIGHPEANCWSSDYKTKDVNLGPQWQREQYAKNFQFNLPYWTSYNEESVPSSTCDALKNYLHLSGQLIAMSENWLPEGGKLCQNDFNNVFIMRHPISRIKSHYQHLFNACRNNNKEEKRRRKCLNMLNDNIWDQGSKSYFNLTVMTDAFDIVSDNYYVRSLNDQSVYKKTFGMNGKGEEYFQSAIRNLRSFDWVILLDSEIDNDENSKNRDLILQFGLGLNQGFGFSNSRKIINPAIANIDFLPTDFEALNKLNKYDMKIWYEAKRLNTLDVQYIEKSSKLHKRTKETETDLIAEENCCGRVCPAKR